MDVFDLVAKIRLDDSEYEQGIGKAKGTFSSLASGLKTGLATVAKVGAAAVSAGVAGVAALTKMGVEGYAQYEQLTGGVETLFGTSAKSLDEYTDSVLKSTDSIKRIQKEAGLLVDGIVGPLTMAAIKEEYESLAQSQNMVMENAKKAYMTAGLSTNAYLETVTSFSASLIQSLGGDTVKAAEVADMAITDMSDNANKMGTSIEMIQNAYNGFAKGNFTMLDNLKLGYGGTQEEMKRLLKDAEAISGIKYDISSFADISEAIHVMQESMGIAGTTAREAATTIEGSLGMMKAAWENLVVGMADENADFDTLINNFVESTAIAAQNLLPRIEQTLQGIGKLIEKLAPVIAEALPVLVEAVLPSLLSAGVSLITALVKGVVTALPALYTALLDAVQIILVQVFGVSEEKAGEFAGKINSFFVRIKDGFISLVKSAQTEGTVLNDIWNRLQQAFELVKTGLEIAFKAVSAAFTWCVEQVSTDGTWLNEIWNGLVLAVRLFQGLLAAAFDAVSAAFRWCVEQFSTEGTALNTVFQVVSTYAAGAFENIKTVISSAIKICQNVIQAFTAVLRGDWSAAWDFVKDAAKNAVDAVGRIFDTCKNTVKNAVAALKKALNFEWSLPKLKLPHINVTGGEAPFGIGGKGSLPSFDIEWYSKAYNRAMVLSNPTIFGASGGKLLGGGDGNGNEVVAGESHLMGLIGQVVEGKLAAQNAQIVALLAALLNETTDSNREIIGALLAGQKIEINGRELGRTVRSFV